MMLCKNSDTISTELYTAERTMSTYLPDLISIPIYSSDS